MTDPKRAHVDDEDRAWAELRALIDPLTDEQLAVDGLETDWSVKDLLAHLGCWMAEAARILEQIRLGTYRTWHGDVDALNRDWWDAWRYTDVRAVKAHLHSSRARMLEEWDRLPPDRLDEVAEEWFHESGARHYDEHLERLREWVGELNGARQWPGA